MALDTRLANKQLMTDPKGSSEFCFPKTLNGKKYSLFPAEPVIKCFVIPPNSKIENEHDLIKCKSKV